MFPGVYVQIVSYFLGAFVTLKFKLVHCDCILLSMMNVAAKTSRIHTKTFAFIQFHVVYGIEPMLILTHRSYAQFSFLLSEISVWQTKDKCGRHMTHVLKLWLILFSDSCFAKFSYKINMNFLNNKIKYYSINNRLIIIILFVHWFHLKSNQDPHQTHPDDVVQQNIF